MKRFSKYLVKLLFKALIQEALGLTVEGVTAFDGTLASLSESPPQSSISSACSEDWEPESSAPEAEAMDFSSSCLPSTAAFSTSSFDPTMFCTMGEEESNGGLDEGKMGMELKEGFDSANGVRRIYWSLLV